MSAVLDWIDVGLRIDVEEDILVFAMKDAEHSKDDYAAICTMAARAELCAVVYGIFSRIDSKVLDPSFSELIAGDWRYPNGNAVEALAAQTDFLANKRVIFSESGNFELGLTPDYSIDGSLDVEVVEYGSARAKVHFELRIRDKVIGRAVLAVLVAAGLLAPSPAPTMESPFIVCSVGKAFQGNRDQIIGDGIEELVDQLGEQDVRGSAKWKARQACLYHAGADPGTFDGDRRKDTMRAEQQFTDLYGVEVDWESRIFVRFLLEKANERMQRDPTFQVITRK